MNILKVLVHLLNNNKVLVVHFLDLKIMTKRGWLLFLPWTLFFNLKLIVYFNYHIKSIFKPIVFYVTFYEIREKQRFCTIQHGVKFWLFCLTIIEMVTPPSFLLE